MLTVWLAKRKTWTAATVRAGSISRLAIVRIRRRFLAAVAIIAMLAVSACSSSDDGAAVSSSVIPSSTLPTETVSPAPTASTSIPSTTAEPTAGPWRADTTSCVNPAEATAPIESTVQVGIVAPGGAGINAAVNAGYVEGFQAAIAAANAANRSTGVLIEVLVGDDAGDATATPAIVEQLISDGADLFSGVVGTGSNAAIRSELNDRCIPQLNVISSAPTWDLPSQWPWTTSGVPSSSVEVSAYADDLDRMVGPTATIAVLYTDNDAGRQYLGDAQSAFGSDRVIAGQATDPANQIDQAAAAGAIAAARPDAVLLAPSSVGCSTAIIALAATFTADWKPRVYLSRGCAGRVVFQLTGAVADGLLTVAHVRDVIAAPNAASPIPTEFVAAFPDQRSVTARENAALGWYIGELTAAIIAQAAATPDGLTRASIINAARAARIEPALAVAGNVFATDGLIDPVGAQTVQVVQWSANSAGFAAVGEPHEAVLSAEG